VSVLTKPGCGALNIWMTPHVKGSPVGPVTIWRLWILQQCFKNGEQSLILAFVTSVFNLSTNARASVLAQVLYSAAVSAPSSEDKRSTSQWSTLIATQLDAEGRIDNLRPIYPDEPRG